MLLQANQQRELVPGSSPKLIRQPLLAWAEINIDKPLPDRKWEFRCGPPNESVPAEYYRNQYCDERKPSSAALSGRARLILRETLKYRPDIDVLRSIAVLGVV